MVKYLNEYKTDFDEVVKNNRIFRPMKNPKKSIMDYLPNIYPTLRLHPGVKMVTPEPTPETKDLFSATWQDNKTYAPKKAVDVGMALYNSLLSFGKTHDAKEMWKAASHDFSQSKKYINKNGTLVYSVSDLPDAELRNFVQNKIKKTIWI